MAIIRCLSISNGEKLLLSVVAAITCVAPSLKKSVSAFKAAWIFPLDRSEIPDHSQIVTKLRQAK
jgi:hypothetical protein